MCAKIGKSANTSRNKKRKILMDSKRKRGESGLWQKKVGKRNFVWLKKIVDKRKTKFWLSFMNN
jgi:hypothetical protein